jgi:enediyne biosynthesis protein E4
MLFFFLFSCTSEKNQDQTCNDGSKYTTGNIFIEKTDEWNLSSINAVGTRISAVDFDGDGWTDLFVRKNTNSDDFANDQRTSWLLRNTGTGEFEDVTEISGIRESRSLATGRPGQVVAFADVDNDGDLDVYTGYNSDGSNSETSEIMLNNGDGSFSLGPIENDIRNANSAQPAGASFVDFNRDGNIDLWLGQASGMQDRLMWGTGDGSFTDVTQPLGVNTKSWSNVEELNQAKGHSVSWSSVACDMNNDGWPELMSASYGRAPNHLWVSQDGEGFINNSILSGYAFDDNQDWSDNESARCWCELHPTDDECTGVPAPEFISCTNDDSAFRWNHQTDRNAYRLGGNSGATVCADINNDGWMDLLTTEIAHWDVGSSSDSSELLYNSQDSSVVLYRPGNETTGLTRTHENTSWDDGDITATVLDFDNDGLIDVYIGSTDYPGTRGLLYHQDLEGTFSLVPDDGFLHARSHGVAVADFDNDGDVDMVIGHSSGRCDDDCPETFNARFYENQTENSNFIQLRLEGTGGSNVAAIGARVTVETESGIQVQDVGGGYGHYGAQNDLLLHFGLGQDCSVDVDILWPDQSFSSETHQLESGKRYLLVQGQTPVEE